MAANAKQHADERDVEHEEFSDATLRRYYGEVTPYGTLPQKDNISDAPRTEDEDGITPLVAQTQQSTLKRPSSGRHSSNTGTLRSTASYGTTLRRSKGGFYTRSPELEISIHNIGYKDFLPKKKKDSIKASKRYHGFSTCVDEANKFLEQNPGVKIKSCESLYVRLDHDHKVNPESTTSHDRSYVIGLRLWYVFEDGDDNVFVSPSAIDCNESATPTNLGERSIQQGKEDEIQRLCYRNVIPHYVNSSGNKTIPSKHRGRPSFEPLDKTMKRFNEDLSAHPIPGQIVSIETIPINYYHGFRDEKELDPEYGYWCLDYHGSWNFFILRIFYVEGTPTQNAYEIDFEDFAPGTSEITEKCPGIHSLTQRASQWLSKEESFKLLSSQTVELSFHPKKIDRRRKMDTRRSTSEFSKVTAHQHMVKILRFWYLKFNKQSSPSPSPSSPSQQSIPSDQWSTRRLRRPGIIVKNFFPCQITTPGCCGLRRPIFATTEDTVDRMKDWISATNAEVLCIQTDNVEKWKGRKCQIDGSLATRLYNKQDFPDSAMANVLEYRLTVFRAFIRADAQGYLEEPDTRDLMRCPTPVEPCCCFVGCSIM